MKRRGTKSTIYCADYITALWTHPWPWPWSFYVKVGNSLISGMGGPIDRVGWSGEWGQGWDGGAVGVWGVWVWVGWGRWEWGVQDRDRGDFWRRCAVDLSSYRDNYIVSIWKLVITDKHIHIKQNGESVKRQLGTSNFINKNNRMALWISTKYCYIASLV